MQACVTPVASDGWTLFDPTRAGEQIVSPRFLDPINKRPMEDDGTPDSEPSAKRPREDGGTSKLNGPPPVNPDNDPERMQRDTSRMMRELMDTLNSRDYGKVTEQLQQQLKSDQEQHAKIAGEFAFPLYRDCQVDDRCRHALSNLIPLPAKFVGLCLI